MRQRLPSWLRKGQSRLLVAGFLYSQILFAQEKTIERVRRPSPDVGVATLATRSAAQFRTLENFEVDADFQFTDRILDSGIDFVAAPVDDCLRNWIPVHYDHGNGVAVADVDGDSLLDLYFTTQIGSNRLYRNLGEGRFRDITERAGVALADRISATASFADVDNDGDPDLFVTTIRHGNALFRNDGEGLFQDVTAAAGLLYSGHSSGSVFFDYDNDGLLDLYVTNVGVYTFDELEPGGFYRGREDAFEGHNFPERTEHSLLYHNQGDLRFREVSAKMGLRDGAWSGDATFVDLNRDTFPDLYVLNMQGNDHYYENQAGSSFVDRTAQLFPKTPWGAMGVKFFDYNNDGLTDLIVTDMHSDMHAQPVDPLRDEKIKIVPPGGGFVDSILGNAFYRQQPDGSFLEMSDLVRAENYWPWGVSVGDLNADGFEDVFISSSMNYPFRYGVNTVLLNNLGRVFFDSEFILGVEPRREGRTHQDLFELDCAEADRGHPACGDKETRILIEGALGTRASAMADIDADGDLDVVTNEQNDIPQLLISDLAQRRRISWLQVKLIGKKSNRDGLGATVRVFAGDHVYSRYLDGKSGYLAQSSMPLYLGLGGSLKVDRVEVDWPSGIAQVVREDLQVSSLLEIIEPAEKIPATNNQPPS